ncbi:MarR family winged helix-turn-helix transcriptional regulator [Goodfellowiella coeruleoviolacea]|uniref:DNA-binding transcriptional regulator, MarR family n=1 Tax=Goodfellowiella coeruleoviolacea TaxID=334858 RepID=A0AAE3GF59_9PSEU|nr:MarR family transcriptional regulator [Goodfellowiella coeruleoviolacea]MCP2166224.1 DNA-binding transcriptional regulator, MarR family [Goodfellowiella coeruleoviolacea]
MAAKSSDPVGERTPSTADPQFAAFAQAADALFTAARRSRGRLAGRSQPALSLSQVLLLAALAEHAELSVSQLADQAGVAVPTATRMLKQLERDGIVTRTRSTADERRVSVSLTEHGSALLTAHHDQLRAEQLRAFQEIEPDQRQLTIELMRRLTALIDAV